MDRNQITGIILISLLLIGYLTFFNQTPSPDQQTTVQTDSLKKNTPAQAAVTTDTASTAGIPDSVLTAKMGIFAAGAKGQATDVVLENKNIRVTLNTYGGRIREVLLKNYKTYDQQPLLLASEKTSQMMAKVQTTTGEIDLNKLYYRVHQSSPNAVSFRIEVAPNQYVEQSYAIKPEGFTVDYNVNFAGTNGVLKSESIAFSWKEDMMNQEKDIEQSRRQSTVNYYTTEGDFEALTETSFDKEESRAEQPVKWVAFKQKFFSSALLTDKTFSRVYVMSEADKTSPKVVKTVFTSLEIPVDDLKAGAGKVRFYFGPNEYHMTKAVAEGFEKNVYLGWSVFAAVNVYLIAPLFEFLEKFIDSYGVIIFILVIIVKLLLLPLAYKSYLSMAKTRVLKPELDAIKAKYGDDMQKVQQENMKLYSQVGVNPVAGCIPALLQMPILLAMFNFFPNAIQLRQESFLWAEDLSTYDSILNLPFTIPFYGDHVSLFTILMTISTIVYTYYNNQMTTTVEGPMKTVSYVMPVVFMFVLNSFSAGLTYYYLVSNIITIAQQLIIRRFVDEDKIRAVMEDNKKKNASGTGKKKSSFQQKLEDAMKAQEEMKKNKKK